MLVSSTRVFFLQPLQDLYLIFPLCSSYLDQEFRNTRTIQCEIRSSFVADGAEGTEIRGFVFASLGFINDVAEVQTCFPRDIVGMWLARDRAAHLTGEPVAIQNERSQFLGNASLEGRLGLRAFEKIFTGLEIVAVVMGED